MNNCSYAGSFTTISQYIGLPNPVSWTKYFVSMTGSGSASGNLSSTQSFAANSTFQFNVTSESGSDLFYGVGA